MTTKIYKELLRDLNNVDLDELQQVYLKNFIMSIYKCGYREAIQDVIEILSEDLINKPKTQYQEQYNHGIEDKIKQVKTLYEKLIRLLTTSTETTSHE